MPRSARLCAVLVSLVMAATVAGCGSDGGSGGGGAGTTTNGTTTEDDGYSRY